MDARPIVVSILIAGATAHAQESTCALSGLVGAVRGAPLSEAQVSSSRANTATLTDSTGRFRLAGLPCGRHEIQVRKIGFTVRRDTLELAPGQEATRTYAMIGVALLDTMKTTADEIQYQVPRLQDFEARRKKGIGGYFIGEADLRKLEAVSMPGILRSRMPGLQFSYYRNITAARGPRPANASEDLRLNPMDLRSPKGCWIVIYLDGVMVFDGKPDRYTLAPDIAQFIAMNLSGVEYYSRASSIPLQFKTTQSNCGTLLFWSRGR